MFERKKKPNPLEEAKPKLSSEDTSDEQLVNFFVILITMWVLGKQDDLQSYIAISIPLCLSTKLILFQED